MFKHLGGSNSPSPVSAHRSPALSSSQVPDPKGVGTPVAVPAPERLVPVSDVLDLSLRLFLSALFDCFLKQKDIFLNEGTCVNIKSIVCCHECEFYFGLFYLIIMLCL